MKLNKDFLTHKADTEQIMVSTDTKKFSGMVRSNKTAAEIVDCLEKEYTKTQIIKHMLETYDAEEKQVAEDVDRVLRILREIGALDE